MAGYDNKQILTGQDVDRTINAREEIFRMITEGLFFSSISASLHTVFTQRSYNIAAEEEKTGYRKTTPEILEIFGKDSDRFHTVFTEALYNIITPKERTEAGSG